MATVTIGSNTYTVFGDNDDALVYFTGSTKYDEWVAYTTDQQNRGLVSATRMLSAQSWGGTLTSVSPTTGLPFPRTGLTDCDGTEIDSETTPEDLVNASFLLALYILDGTIVTTTNTTQNATKRLKADTVEIEYFRLSPDVAGGRWPQDIQDLIGCFLASGTSTISGGISYGTDGTPADTDFTVSESF